MEEDDICETSGHSWVDSDRGHYCQICGKVCPLPSPQKHTTTLKKKEKKKVEIVSDNFERTVEFVDLGGGIGEKQGTYVSHDIPSYGIRGQESRRKRIITGLLFFFFFSSSSSFLTLLVRVGKMTTVKGLIQELVSQIGGMSDLMSDKAYRIFKLADRSNFVRGRKTQLVIASCIYIACRIEETPLPYMLIDFSDAIQVSPLFSLFLLLVLFSLKKKKKRQTCLIWVVSTSKCEGSCVMKRPIQFGGSCASLIRASSSNVSQS